MTAIVHTGRPAVNRDGGVPLNIKPTVTTAGGVDGNGSKYRHTTSAARPPAIPNNPCLSTALAKQNPRRRNHSRLHAKSNTRPDHRPARQIQSIHDPNAYYYLRAKEAHNMKHDLTEEQIKVVAECLNATPEQVKEATIENLLVALCLIVSAFVYRAP